MSTAPYVEPLDAEVDPIQIQQVLVNLVQNAIQALQCSPPGDRRITLRACREGTEAIVECADNGPGFATDPEAASHSFSTTRPDGLGMGLSISRSLVQDHDGRLWIESAPGRGARILFSLPLAPTHEPRLPERVSAIDAADGVRR